MKHIFISAELSNLSSTENEFRTARLYEALEGLELSGHVIDRVDGMYKGVKETSFRVTVADNDILNVGMFRGMARRLGQESILWVKDDGSSFLDYIQSGEMHHIGVMKQVDWIDNLEAYSIIKGQVFTVA